MGKLAIATHVVWNRGPYPVPSVPSSPQPGLTEPSASARTKASGPYHTHRTTLMRSDCPAHPAGYAHTDVTETTLLHPDTSCCLTAFTAVLGVEIVVNLVSRRPECLKAA